MADYGTTLKHTLRYLLGTSQRNEIDEGFKALADDIDALMAIFDQGTSRPTSTSGSPGKAGRFFRHTGTNVVSLDHGTGWLDLLVGALTDRAEVTGDLLSTGAIHIGRAYTEANGYLAAYVGSNIRWDQAAGLWRNDPTDGDNGWALIGLTVFDGTVLIFGDGGSGNVQRTYTPAQFLAKRRGRPVTSDAEHVRTVRGRVTASGATAGGAGFTVSKQGTGWYLLTFGRSFPSAPAVSPVAVSDGAAQPPQALVGAVATNSVHVFTFDGAGNRADRDFHFSALG
jgi:hypothetical protein